MAFLKEIESHQLCVVRSLLVLKSGEEKVVKKNEVLICNFGGPEKEADVQPFLYNLFYDPLVIKTPFGPFRKMFANCIEVPPISLAAPRADCGQIRRKNTDCYWK